LHVLSRKKIYRIGILLIFVAVLQPPLSLLIFGKYETGLVVKKVMDVSILAQISGVGYYPSIEFNYKGITYSFQDEENQDYEIGDKVTVIFYKWQPQKARILTFGDLFVDPLIELPIGLLIWWALFQSYPNLFKSSNELPWYINLIRNKRAKKEED
jgi:hypothetical protein